MNDVLELTGTQAVGAIRSGELSAEELFEAYRARAAADELNAFTWVAEEAPSELAGRILGGGHVIDVEARGAAVRNQLAAAPGVVRVQVLGPDLYRVDCERDLRAEIARRLAPSFDLLGIRFAEPSLNEVYTRYFDEVRDAA